MIARVLKQFLATEASGGIALLAATTVALILANSPLSEAFHDLWATDVEFHLGPVAFPHDIHHWINDGLMAIFFFVVALEIKRELVTGELATLRRASLPAIAAIGGMVVPALIYLALNDGAERVGWGIPMATDIAFAVGIISLFGERIPTSAKVFLLSLAIVDDIGAIAVIAIFYSGGVSAQWMGITLLMLGGVGMLRIVGVRTAPMYVVFGIATWIALFQSGVHATLAGVALGMLTPARSREEGKEPIGYQLEHALHPWTSYVVVPLFALANAGIVLSTDSVSLALGSSVTLGIVLGLVAGKLAGISFATWLAVKLRVAELPDSSTWGHIIGLAAVAGVGFTVSLFITELAFTDVELTDAAKMGVFAGSLIAGGLGAAILWRTCPTPDATRDDEQITGRTLTAE
ncbi:MAG TPA: Na+/H+ antiporter NhaA [Actinomycetota bacterium]|nr:Na+/H+ antiporter NhaA [Actinomycetota bacterium]